MLQNNNFKKWFESEEQSTFKEMQKCVLTENKVSRYSVEVNYRTNLKEVIDGFSKLVLGFLSAACKNNGNFHVKMVHSEKPYRIIVSERNFQDGEYACVVQFSESLMCFTISTGFYNKGKKTVNIQSTVKAKGMSASEIANEILSTLRELEKKPAYKIDMNAPKKRGPKS